VTLLPLLGAFLLCATAILLTGIRLARYGNVIAQRSGLGGTWIGVILMASVTSLPELLTGGTSALVGLPNIAVGDAVGSCMFNLLIFALLDVRNPDPLSARIHQGHVLAAGFGSAMLAVTGLALAGGTRAPAIGWIGLHSLVLLAGYVLAMRMIYHYERTRAPELARAVAEELGPPAASLRRATTIYLLNAVILMAAAAFLPEVAHQLALASGVGPTFIGTLLVASSTSLPEIVVSVAAVRIGAIDMAAGNLFGSNLFNLAILGLDDVLYRHGVLLAQADPAHAISVMGALGMTAVAIIGVTYRAAKKRYRLSWDSFAMVTIYVVAMLMLHAATS
jgi:cation:H+ antiporter